MALWRSVDAKRISIHGKEFEIVGSTFITPADRSLTFTAIDVLGHPFDLDILYKTTAEDGSLEKHRLKGSFTFDAVKFEELPESSSSKTEIIYEIPEIGLKALATASPGFITDYLAAEAKFKNQNSFEAQLQDKESIEPVPQPESAQKENEAEKPEEQDTPWGYIGMGVGALILVAAIASNGSGGGSGVDGGVASKQCFESANINIGDTITTSKYSVFRSCMQRKLGMSGEEVDRVFAKAFR